jgi:hypothetical protein
MAKVKKMAFGGLFRSVKSKAKPVAQPVAQPVGGPMGSAMTGALAKGLNKMNAVSAAKPANFGTTGGLSGALKNAVLGSNPSTPATNAGGLGGMMSGGAEKALGAPTLKSLQGPTAKPGAMMKKGGKVSSASKRADGCATKGKTRGKIV